MVGGGYRESKLFPTIYNLHYDINLFQTLLACKIRDNDICRRICVLNTRCWIHYAEMSIIRPTEQTTMHMDRVRVPQVKELRLQNAWDCSFPWYFGLHTSELWNGIVLCAVAVEMEIAGSYEMSATLTWPVKPRFKRTDVLFIWIYIAMNRMEIWVWDMMLLWVSVEKVV
jgi:hypothetical protein